MIVILVKYYVHTCVLFKVYQSPAMAPCLGALLRFLPKLASILSVVFDGPHVYLMVELDGHGRKMRIF